MYFTKEKKMNRGDARKIAETITNQQLAIMLQNARNNVPNWTVTSNVNKGFSKGLAWNLLAKDFDSNTEYHVLTKTNMIREFGEYLPEELKPEPRSRRVTKPPIHEEPIF